jgi:hypothetical protein
VEPVPLVAAEWIGQQLVGLLNGQEALLVAAAPIGVEALCEPPMRSLDLTQVGAGKDAEDAVGILARLECGHARSARRT